MYIIMFKAIPKDKTIAYCDSWNVINGAIKDIETARIEKKKFIDYSKRSKSLENYRVRVEISNLVGGEKNV